jgi:dTDP-4-dehydrorhamnose reductase
LDKLLVIGDTGLVGSKVASMAASAGYEAHGTHNARGSIIPRSVRLNIVDRDATMNLFEQVRPTAVVNTAALHNVDYCETHREEAEKVNVEGTRNLADAAAKYGSRLLHLSTDYVFDGFAGHYTEEDQPHPLHYYAETKLESEKVASQAPSYAIARPSVIYGWNPLEASGVASSSGKTINFAMFVLDKLKKNEPVKAVRDQYSSPTFADNLAQAILKLARFQGNGVFHTAGRTCMSRYEFAVKLAQLFDYPKDLIQPVYTSDFKQAAQRPKNSCLKVDKAEHLLGMRFMTAEEGIREMRRQASSMSTLPA